MQIHTVEREADKTRVAHTKSSWFIFGFSADSVWELRKQLLSFDSPSLTHESSLEMVSKVNMMKLNQREISATFVIQSVGQLKAGITDLLIKLKNDPEIFGIKETSWGWYGRNQLQHDVGFLFPGQGAQQIAMGKQLIDQFPWALKLANRADEIFKNKNQGKSLLGYINGHNDVDGSAQTVLSQTFIAQPALCLVSYLWSEFLSRLGISPKFVGGLSLGEVSAMAAANVFDFETLMQIACDRGILMSQQSKGLMALVNASAKLVSKFAEKCDGYVTVSGINSNDQCTVSGDLLGVVQLCQLVKKNGITYKMLVSSSGFHSELMARVSEELSNRKYQVDLLPGPEILLSVFSHEFHNFDDPIRYLSTQLSSQIDFFNVVKKMSSQVDFMIEVGSGNVISKIVDGCDVVGPCLSVESSVDSNRDLLRVLSYSFVVGVPIQWNVLFKSQENSI